MIETDRCLCAPVAKEDYSGILELYRNTEVGAYLGGIIDESSFEDRFKKLLAPQKAYAWTAKLKSNASFLGLVTLDKHHDSEDMEISYQFAQAFWGRGYAREVLGPIIK